MNKVIEINSVEHAKELLKEKVLDSEVSHLFKQTMLNALQVGKSWNWIRIYVDEYNTTMRQQKTITEELENIEDLVLYIIDEIG